MKTKCKIILLIIIIVTLFIPILRCDYYNGYSTKIRKYSIVTSLLEDAKEQSFMTLELVKNWRLGNDN